MRLQRHGTWWLQFIAIFLGLILVKAVFIQALPSASGVVGFALYVVLFLTPWWLLNWLYFRIGKD